jgi:hypothetical protein
MKLRLGEHPREYVEACTHLPPVPLPVLAAEGLGGNLLPHAESIEAKALRLQLWTRLPRGYGVEQDWS